jgi:hypothetical protein
LEEQLAKLPPPKKIHTQRQLDSSCANLTKAIQRTIKEQVPITEITLKLKRWWTKELMQLRKQVNKLGRLAYKCRHDCTHIVHVKHTKATKRYKRTLKNTKQQHWCNWIEKVDNPDIWTVHHIISAPSGKTSCNNER